MVSFSRRPSDPPAPRLRFTVFGRMNERRRLEIEVRYHNAKDRLDLDLDGVNSSFAIRFNGEDVVIKVTGDNLRASRLRTFLTAFGAQATIVETGLSLLDGMFYHDLDLEDSRQAYFATHELLLDKGKELLEAVLYGPAGASVSE